MISRNPVRRLSQNRRWHIIPRRQVVVPDEMLPQWFAAVQAIRQEKIRDYVVFVLLTGMRKMEAAQLRWDDIDFPNGVITVRAAHTKNRIEYCLPGGPISLGFCAAARPWPAARRLYFRGAAKVISLIPVMSSKAPSPEAASTGQCIASAQRSSPQPAISASLIIKSNDL